MFKGFNNKQQNGFPNLSFFGDRTAYGQSGCNFWMRADFGLNTQTNLGAVSRWVDIVNGNIFEQTTAGAQPRLLTSSVLYNNLPVIEFQDSNRFIPILSGSLNSRTIAFIANYDVINNRNTVIGATSGISLGGTVAGINGVSFVNAAGTTFSGTTENTNVKICVISDNLIMVNGVIENTSVFNIDYSFNQIGRSAATSFNTLTGKVAEIIGYSIPVNQDQALAISTQLNQKYVIY